MLYERHQEPQRLRAWPVFGVNPLVCLMCGKLLISMTIVMNHIVLKQIFPILSL